MPKTHESASEVEIIAKGLIANYHSELATARIMYVFVSEASNKNGKVVYGTIRKLTGFFEWCIEQDFVVFVALDKWQELTVSQRSALVDHLLERCYGEEDENSGEMKWKVREPDVQEFSNILNRHGVWNEDLQGFVSVAKEINLDQLMDEVIETEETIQIEES